MGLHIGRSVLGSLAESVSKDSSKSGSRNKRRLRDTTETVGSGTRWKISDQVGPSGPWILNSVKLTSSDQKCYELIGVV